MKALTVKTVPVIVRFSRQALGGASLGSTYVLHERRFPSDRQLQIPKCRQLDGFRFAGRHNGKKQPWMKLFSAWTQIHLLLIYFASIARSVCVVIPRPKCDVRWEMTFLDRRWTRHFVRDKMEDDQPSEAEGKLSSVGNLSNWVKQIAREYFFVASCLDVFAEYSFIGIQKIGSKVAEKKIIKEKLRHQN